MTFNSNLYGLDQLPQNSEWLHELMTIDGGQCQTISQCTNPIGKLAIRRNFSHVYYKSL
jgi:hypothetical protein